MKRIVGNWKSNPASLAEAKKLAEATDHPGVVIAPPFPHLEAVRSVLMHASLGAQDMFWEDGGAFTGEVSASQLKGVGVGHVILGHSERRIHLGETDVMINRKVKAALAAGLEVILCIGEHIETRKRGIEAAKRFITDQLTVDLGGVAKRHAKKVLVGYEPIWAIGTGTSDIPEETAEIAAYIKNLVEVSGVIYGGSVNAKNAAEFLGQPEIDGALVGGASLNPKEFGEIVRAAG